MMRSAKSLIGLCAGFAMASAPASGQDLADLLADELFLGDYTLTEIDVPEDRPEAFQTQFEFEGEVYTLDLEKHSVRAPGYRVLVDDGQGPLREVAPPPVSTYRGEVVEIPGSIASLSITESGVDVQIAFPGQENEPWAIQPVSDVDPTQPADLHVAYTTEDMLPTPYECGVDHLPGIEHKPAPQAPAGPNPRLDIVSLTELAWDVDFPAFQELGGSVNNAIAEVEGITNDVTEVYERDVAITYEITTTIVRTSSGADPYTSGEISVFINQVQAEWGPGGPQQDVQRDLVHVLTGRDLRSGGFTGVIGVAPTLGSVCSIALGFAISENLSNSFSETGLVAHEMGHNWSSPHCDQAPNISNPCNIMCSGLGGCNGLGQPNFGPGSIAFIENHRDSRGCLDDIPVGLVDLPFVEEFPSGILSIERWEEATGAFSIIGDGGAPTPPFAGSFTGQASLTTLPVGTQDPGGPLAISLAESRIGVSEGVELTIEAQDGVDGAFTEIGSVVATDEGFTPYQTSTFMVPGFAIAEGIRFRLSTGADLAGGTWRFDNITIDVTDGFQLPFSHTFPTADLDTSVWPVVGGLTTDVTTDAQNEPSAPFSLSLPTSLIESANLLAEDQTGTPHVIRFFVQPSTNETGSLFASYRNDAGSFQLLDVLSPSDFPSDEFTELVFDLPADGFHDELALRFSNTSGNGGTTWFIDDVSVEPGSVDKPCPADLTGPGGDGVPDGNLTGDDFFFYLGLFADGDPDADLTGPGGDGVPDGNLTSDDFFFYLGLFSAGCP